MVKRPCKQWYCKVKVDGGKCEDFVYMVRWLRQWRQWGGDVTVIWWNEEKTWYFNRFERCHILGSNNVFHFFLTRVVVVKAQLQWVDIEGQNFCLPFLFHFNILFILIEKSRIPIIDNSRTWQHRERYSPNKGSKPSGFCSEKPVNSFTKWICDFF